MTTYIWKTTPQDSNFDNPNNWSGGISGTAPSSSSTAEFGTSSITSLTFPFFSSSNSAAFLTFLPGAPAYTFTVAPYPSLPDPVVFIIYVQIENESSSTESFSVTGLLGATAYLEIAGPIYDTGGGGVDLSVGYNGTIQFAGGSAGDATITTNNGGLLAFSAAGVSTSYGTAGQARLITNAGGSVDFSGDDVIGLQNDKVLNPYPTAGSIEGAGNYFLGIFQFTVGSNNLSTEVSGVIADGGGAGGSGASLVKTGSGTLILSGSNTYTGGTTVNGGTLQLGDGGASGSIIGGVTDNATFAIDRSDTVTFGLISGSGGFEQLGTGTTIFNAHDGYAGGTTVDAGTLQLGSGASLATGGALTINGGTLELNGKSLSVGDLSGTGGTLTLGGGALTVGTSDSTSFSGAITGTGLVVKTGTGTLTLAGANAYSGGTVVEDGTLQLGNGGTSGSLTGAVLDDGVLAVDRSDVVTIANSIVSSGAFDQVGTGTVILTAVNSYSGGTTVESGTLLIDGSTANSVITVDSGGSIGGSGTAGAVTVEAGGTFAPGDPSTFTVASLTLDSGATFDEQIGGTAPGTGGAGGYDQTVVESGGAVALGGATLDVSLVNSFTPSTGESFTVIDNETGDPVSGTFDGLAQGAVFEADGTWFQISYDGGANNQDVTVTDVACYCRGTLIRTACGNKRVEKLQIGDEVMTASGAARPIKWIGRRSYGGRFVMGRKDILPVCFKTGSLADNVPNRDLWISPHHAMFIDDVLIEAKDLINGVSIVQAAHVDKVEYFHIELDSHDIILAEGAASESFIDDDSRGMFHNAHDYDALYPDVVTEPAHYCAPRLDEGYEVEAVRRRIALRARLVGASDGPRTSELRGYVDLVSETCIAGWAQSVDHPEAAVCLDIYAGGRLIGQALANCYRQDLQRAGLGSGRHSFSFMPPARLDGVADTLEVRRSLDGAGLSLSAQAKRGLLHQAAA